MTAMFVGGIATALFVLHGFGLAGLHPKATFYAADVTGGLLLGAGIALAGACPGTVLAQMGVGYRDAIFTLLGGIAGAIASSYAEPLLRPLLLSGGPGRVTLAALTGIDYWVLAISLSVVLAAVLFGVETWRPWRRDIGGDVDGYFGGETGARAGRIAEHEPAE